MDVVKKCKDMWHSAECEGERLAAIQEIIRLAKSSHLLPLEKKEMLDVIGFSYLSGLLQNDTLSDESSVIVCKSAALSVLAAFSVDSEIANSELLCSMTVEFKSILNADLFSPNTQPLVMDALKCVHNMTKYEKSRNLLLSSGMIPCLVKLFVTDTFARNWILQILKDIAFHYSSFYFRSETGDDDSAAFELMLLKMIKEMPSGGSDVGIHDYKCAMNILCDPLSKIQGDEEWVVELQDVLLRALKGTVSKEIQDLAITLASLLVGKCGSFFLDDDAKQSEVFLLVLVHSACVRVQHAIEHRTVEDVLKDTFVLSACFSVFESVISATAEDNSWNHPQPSSKHLKASLQSAYKSARYLLFMMSAKWNSICDIPEVSLKELTCDAVRVLCSWLGEETHISNNDDICKIIPYMLGVCEGCFLTCQSTGSLSNEIGHVDLMRYFLPPLDRLLFSDDLRGVLLERGLMDIMFQYLMYQWPFYRKNPSVETETMLCTVCKIALTVICMDAKVVHESEIFFSLLKFLLSIIPLLPTGYESLCLKANFSALGLLITKHHYKRIKSCETSFYRFLSFSIKFLWDSHHVEDGTDSISFVLVREYRHIWPDIMEPWFLGMQALSTLLPVMPWITDFLMQSGWPQHIIASLIRVGEKAIEGSVKYAYQAFLCTLVRVSRSAVQTLIDCEALYVCKKHKLKELEELLSM